MRPKRLIHSRLSRAISANCSSYVRFGPNSHFRPSRSWLMCRQPVLIQFEQCRRGVDGLRQQFAARLRQPSRGSHPDLSAYSVVEKASADATAKIHLRQHRRCERKGAAARPAVHAAPGRISIARGKCSSYFSRQQGRQQFRRSWRALQIKTATAGAGAARLRQRTISAAR